MFFFFSRTLLTQDYGFLQKINLWPPFVTIGIYCSSLSAAMCAMIGASRILHALAVDQLFGEAANPSRRRLLCTLFSKRSLYSSQVCRWLQPPLRQTRGTRGWRCCTLGVWHRSAHSLQCSVVKISVWQVSWTVVGVVFVFQCVVFAGQLNAIASLVTVFYLLAYAAVDLACLALEWASAPNFRY